MQNGRLWITSLDFKVCPMYSPWRVIIAANKTLVHYHNHDPRVATRIKLSKINVMEPIAIKLIKFISSKQYFICDGM